MRARARDERERSGRGGLEAKEEFPVTIAGGFHLYPYRTQKLSLHALMVLGWERPGRVGRCRDPKRGSGGNGSFSRFRA